MKGRVEEKVGVVRERKIGQEREGRDAEDGREKRERRDMRRMGQGLYRGVLTTLYYTLTVQLRQ